MNFQRISHSNFTTYWTVLPYYKAHAAGEKEKERKECRNGNRKKNISVSRKKIVSSPISPVIQPSSSGEGRGDVGRWTVLFFFFLGLLLLTLTRVFPPPPAPPLWWSLTQVGVVGGTEETVFWHSRCRWRLAGLGWLVVSSCQRQWMSGQTSGVGGGEEL